MVGFWTIMAGKAAPCVLATAEGAATVGTPVEAPATKAV